MKAPHGIKRTLFIYVEKVKVHRVLSSLLELLVAAKKAKRRIIYVNSA